MATFDLNYFFLAAQTGNINILRTCLNTGIDIHTYNDLALRYAKQNGQIEAVIFLLENGANIYIFNDDSILRFSSIRGDYKTMKELLAKNCCSQQAKLYSMFNAMFYGYDEIVKLLLDNGVSPTTNDSAILKVLKLCKYPKILALFDDYLK